ncbi:Uncharacterized protein conserved in bacteria [Serratia odorifera]|uniref:2-oxoadipate dioxygenase/decarboxylase n=1 Tax=Serratia odorifera TaxID=618 RepID=A0A3S4DT39_SEROD|nr:Uncharacterized protein conserved in bacteria [Serratia odorifera]
MTAQQFISPNEIRAKFSHAMSDMYQKEVPLYGALLDLVAETNRELLSNDAELAHQLQITGEIERLAMERHGAIRVGTAHELATLRRLFNVMGHGAGRLLRSGGRWCPRAFHRISCGT